MSRFTDIQGRFSRLYARRYEPDGARVLTQYFWSALITCAFLLVVCSIAWGLWDLVGAFDVLAQGASPAPLPPSSINRAALDRVVQSFDARQAQFDTFSANPPPAIPDPSK